MESIQITRAISTGGYVSFWSACYVGGCALLAGVLLGADHLVLPVVTAFLIAMQVYTLHRLRRASSHPGSPTPRSAYIFGHRRLMLVMIVFSGAGAVIAK